MTVQPPRGVDVALNSLYQQPYNEVRGSLTMWTRVPLLLRALLSALAVTGTATVVWGALVAANLRFTPSLPWAAILMTAFLIFYWKFLQGWGWPRSTSAARRASLRAEPLSPAVWRWSLLAGGLGLGTSIVLLSLIHI